METLADIKGRAAAGTRLEVVAHTRRPELVGTIRTITRILSPASYAFTSSHTDGEVHTGTWPHPIEVVIRDGDTFEYALPRPARHFIIRLRFMAQAAPLGAERRDSVVALAMRRLRRERQLSYRAAAVLLGMDPSNVCRAELGQRTPPTAGIVAQAFGVPVADVLAPCPHCSYRPPAGYVCVRCGTGQSSAAR